MFHHAVGALCFVYLPAVFASYVVSLPARVYGFVDGIRSSRLVEVVSYIVEVLGEVLVVEVVQVGVSRVRCPEVEEGVAVG